MVERPDRLIYLSSGMHQPGDPDFADLQWEQRRWNSAQAYADSKLLDAALSFIVAGRWTEVSANAVEPGWVATKMGGAAAPDDMAQAPLTQVWLAVGSERLISRAATLTIAVRGVRPCSLRTGRFINCCWRAAHR